MSKSRMRAEAEAVKKPAEVKTETAVKETEAYYSKVLENITAIVEDAQDIIILSDVPDRDEKLEMAKRKGEAIWKKARLEKEKSLAKPNSDKPDWIKKVHDGEVKDLDELCGMVLGTSTSKPVNSKHSRHSKPTGSKVTEKPVTRSDSKSSERGILAEVWVDGREKPFKVTIYPSPDEKGIYACYATEGGKVLLKNRAQAEQFMEMKLKTYIMRVERVPEPWIPGVERKILYKTVGAPVPCTE